MHTSRPWKCAVIGLHLLNRGSFQQTFAGEERLRDEPKEGLRGTLDPLMPPQTAYPDPMACDPCSRDCDP